MPHALVWCLLGLAAELHPPFRLDVGTAARNAFDDAAAFEHREDKLGEVGCGINYRLGD